MDKVRTVLRSLEENRESLKCARTKRKAQYVNIGEKYLERPFMCAKCILQYEEDVSPLNTISIEDFIEEMRDIVERENTACPTEDQVYEEMSEVYQTIVNTMYTHMQQTIHTISSELLSDISHHMKAHLKSRSLAETSQSPEALHTDRTVLIDTYHFVNSDNTQRSQLHLSTISERLPEYHGDDGEDINEDIIQQVPGLYDATGQVVNRQLKELFNKLEIAPIILYSINSAPRHILQDEKYIQPNSNMAVCFTAKKDCYIYGFCLGLPILNPVNFNITIYSLTMLQPTSVIAAFDVSLPSSNHAVKKAYPSQPPKSHYVPINPPLSISRGCTYTIVIKSLLTSPYNIIFGKHESRQGSYVNGGLAETEEDGFLVSFRESNLCNNGCDMFNSPIFEFIAKAK